MGQITEPRGGWVRAQAARAVAQKEGEGLNDDVEILRRTLAIANGEELAKGALEQFRC